MEKSRNFGVAGVAEREALKSLLRRLMDLQWLQHFPVGYSMPSISFW